MSGSSGVLEFLAWALWNFSLGVNLVSYKSPLDFTPNFGSSFGEGIVGHLRSKPPLALWDYLAS